MRWCVAMLVLAGGTVAAIGQTDAEKIEQEWKRLLGEWSVVSVEEQGGRPPKEVLKDMAVVFKDRAMLIRTKAGDDEAAATINPSKQPKWIETKDKKYGDVMHGIYELDGDTLKLCLGRSGKRPEKFAVSGRDERLIVLKRKK